MIVVFVGRHDDGKTSKVVACGQEEADRHHCQEFEMKDSSINDVKSRQRRNY